MNFDQASTTTGIAARRGGDARPDCPITEGIEGGAS